MDTMLEIFDNSLEKIKVLGFALALILILAVVDTVTYDNKEGVGVIGGGYAAIINSNIRYRPMGRRGYKGGLDSIIRYRPMGRRG